MTVVPKLGKFLFPGRTPEKLSKKLESIRRAVFFGDLQRKAPRGEQPRGAWHFHSVDQIWPVVDEIAPDLRQDRRVLIYGQAALGVPVRMAILLTLLDLHR